MKDLVKERCDLLTINRQTLRKKYALEDNIMILISSIVFTLNNKEADIAKMSECRKLLSKRTSFLSSLRKTMEILVVSKMTLEEEPEAYLDKLKLALDKIKKRMEVSNSYAVLGSLLLCDYVGPEKFDEVIDKSSDIMNRMNKEHPILTSSRDTANIMALALSYKDEESIIAELEEGYEYLKKECKTSVGSDSIQEICEYLVLSYGDIKGKCDKVVKLLNTFAAHKARFGTGYEFATLGTLIDIDMDVDTLVSEIIEVEDYLKDKPGFKADTVNQKKRLMYASILVASTYMKATPSSANPVITNMVSIVTDQQIAQMISISTSILSSLVSKD